jgi:hypothetical protein
MTMIVVFAKTVLLISYQRSTFYVHGGVGLQSCTGMESIPMTERSKARVCGRLRVRIAGSKLAEGMAV